MKTIFKIIAWIIALALIVLFLAFYFTSGITDTADKFFNAVRNKNIDEAYSYVSSEFKSNTNKQQFEQFLETYSLSQYKEASWNSRSVINNTGKLTGNITTIDNNVLPITIDLIKNGDDWKIIYIQRPSTGVGEKVVTAKLPSEQELIKLTTDTMHIFAESVAEQNMQKIRDLSSSLFQKQISLEHFNNSYQSFFKLGDKLMIIDKLSVQFTEKSYIDDKGILHIKGLYPTTPNPIVFYNKYIFEGYGWKILGLKVDI